MHVQLDAQKENNPCTYLHNVDSEIFICRNFRLLNFRLVIFSSLSTLMKIKHAEN